MLVLIQQLGHKVLQLVGVLDLVLGAVGENNLSILDLHLQHVLVFVEERSDTNEHLVHEHADGPPVDRKVVTRLLENLGGHVLRRASNGTRQLSLLQALSQSKVNQLDVAILIEQDVLKLHVSVSDALLVQVADAENELNGIELD